MALVEGKSRRFIERQRASLPITVKGFESAGGEWQELTQLIDMTRSGALFFLEHPVETGQLLHLTFQMPKQFRAFDILEKDYRIWSVARNIMKLQPPEAIEPDEAGAENTLEENAGGANGGQLETAGGEKSFEAAESGPPEEAPLENEPGEVEPERFKVGVAFIGKAAPSGFLMDPSKRYELSYRPRPDGLWDVRERPRKEWF